MKIIIVRHGESLGNLKKIVSSTLPGVDLSDNGVEQVKQTGAEISSKYSFDKVYASPFMRTMHTAEILNSFIQKENIIPDLRIGEMFFGLYDGKGNEEMENEMQLYIKKIEEKDFSMRMGGIGDSEYSFRRHVWRDY